MDLVAEQITLMYDLRAQYEGLLEQRAANRSLMRTLQQAGALTDEQVAEVEAIYPARAPRGS